MDPPTRFLKALYEDKPPELYLLIWTLPEKRSYWFKEISEAVRQIHALPPNTDVYFGVGLSAEDYGPNRRCKPEQVAAIPGLWADIDIAHDLHNKNKKLPRNEAEAREFLKGLRLQPQMIVHSGHGLQCYWRLKELWVFENEAERQGATEFCNGWAKQLKEEAAAAGYNFDTVHDLSRVMRVPGTNNCKDPDNIIVVELLEVEETRQFDFEKPRFEDPALPEEEKEKKEESKPKYTAGSLKLKPGAEPPHDKLMALLCNEPKFRRSWERTRKDMRDPSASGYDLSLALFTVRALWTDQEIVNLLIASRRYHSDNLKLREDYYARTIAKARQMVEKSETGDALGDLAEQARDDEQTRKERLDQLEAHLGMPIRRVLRYVSNPPFYHIVLRDNVWIPLGKIENLVEQRPFRNRVADWMPHVVKTMKPAIWNHVASNLRKLCEDVEVGEEASLKGRVRNWMRIYIDDHPPQDDLEDAIANRYPLKRGDKIAIFADSFRRWIRMAHHENIDARELASYLRSNDCVPHKLPFRRDGKSTSYAIYWVPESLFEVVGDNGEAEKMEDPLVIIEDETVEDDAEQSGK